MTAERVEGLVFDLPKYARYVEHVPAVYPHPLDPDDSHYVDLAVATGSRLIVSRDAHLLNLMEPGRPEREEFHRQFPSIEILSPDLLLARMRER